jgi:hypothetical protein
VSALVLFNPPHLAIGDKPKEPASQRESWYHHFHALPWSDQLVGFSRATTELYLRHFYDHWVGNKDSVRSEEFEAIVDAFARPGALRASFGWYRATYEEETDPSAYTKDPIPLPTVVRWASVIPSSRRLGQKVSSRPSPTSISGSCRAWGTSSLSRPRRKP